MGLKKSVLILASMALGLLLVCGVAWAQGEESTDGDGTIRPTVISTMPTPRTTCVNSAANISAFFSEDMNASTIDDASVRLYEKGSTNQLATSVRYGAKKDRAIINPTDPLEGGVTYRAVVTTYVKDLAGNRLDQDVALDGLQRKAWTFTKSADSQTPLECKQAAAVAAGEAAARLDLRNAATAASACATDFGSFVDCDTIAMLNAYGFNPTTGVVANGMNGSVLDWSAAMQHTNGGSAYTYANFGENAGQVIEAPRGTSAPTLPDRTAEWESIARSALEDAIVPANECVADHDYYVFCDTMAELAAYGLTGKPDVVYSFFTTGVNQMVITTQHINGGSAYQYDTATGEIEPSPSS